MTKRLLSWLLMINLCLNFGTASLAESDDEDVFIGIFVEEKDADVVEAEATAAPFNPTDPIYEADGSILITMSFAGDILIGTNTQSSQDTLFEDELKKQGGNIDFPFRNVTDIFQADDLSMINFESTLTTADKNTDRLSNDVLLRASSRYASMLLDGGIDTVTLENTHALDMGTQGLSDTKKALDGVGITYATEQEPRIFVRRGITIGSLAYQAFDRYEELTVKVPTDIEMLRKKGCDIVIVSYHWGTEGAYAPDEQQVALGHITIDVGADLVIGSHSGRINPIELYNDRYICYSLGSFINVTDPKPNDMSAFIFQIKMRVKDDMLINEQIKIIPIRISSRRDYNDFAPTPYSKDENIDAILRTLRQNGKNLPDAITDFPLQWLGEE